MFTPIKDDNCFFFEGELSDKTDDMYDALVFGGVFTIFAAVFFAGMILNNYINIKRQNFSEDGIKRGKVEWHMRAQLYEARSELMRELKYQNASESNSCDRNQKKPGGIFGKEDSKETAWCLTDRLVDHWDKVANQEFEDAFCRRLTTQFARNRKKGPAKKPVNTVLINK